MMTNHSICSLTRKNMSISDAPPSNGRGESTRTLVLPNFLLWLHQLENICKQIPRKLLLMNSKKRFWWSPILMKIETWSLCLVLRIGNNLICWRNYQQKRTFWCLFLNECREHIVDVCFLTYFGSFGAKLFHCFRVITDR